MRGAKLTLFGSSCNGFGLARSDLDICLTFENSEDAKADDLPRQLKGLLWRNRDLTAVSFVSRARVPVIKFLHQPTGLEGDLSIGNILALRNTMLLKTYSEIDRRVRVLGYAFKFLAKRFGIGDASHSGMCSYAFILMTIFYLQQCKPAVLPVLQEGGASHCFQPNEGINFVTLQLHPSRMQKPEEMVEGCNVWFFHDMKRLDSVWSGRGRNTMDAGELWLGMMKFYEDFNFQEQVVSVRQSAPLLKTEKGWDALVAIEDPFCLDRNLGKGLSKQKYRATMGAFVRGRFLFEEPMVDFLPADATSHACSEPRQVGRRPTSTCQHCRVCEGKLHRCPNSRGKGGCKEKGATAATSLLHKPRHV
ncbi:terminal uridylyltransferase 4-like [Dermacentor silvarum]|uniref:terminal uridylyltransferase 4-like n=1 Tax=Dermacentor silvarum TaxID=543639 RepID=UPI002100DFEA|nr:terminal uridylyltransferase 4-like [Dermacentor silvarum]